MGVDAVEPDVVATKDGVLVVRHENEISGTTDVALRPEFASRRTTKRIDGKAMTGWFTEDFTWEELRTLSCRERLPDLRRSSASFDGRQGVLRLSEVLDLVRAAPSRGVRGPGVVIEVKHATYFASIGLDLVPLLTGELRETTWADSGRQLMIESFEPTVLRRLREAGVRGSFIALAEARGAPFDLVTALGADAPSYRAMLEPSGLDSLAGDVDGISVDKRSILAPTKLGRVTGPTSVVADAHARGLLVYTWTCRPENAFLVGEFRSSGGPDAFGDYESEWEIIRGSGVDGVFVDHPDLGIAAFRD